MLSVFNIRTWWKQLTLKKEKNKTYETKYWRMYQVKFMEDNL